MVSIACYRYMIMLKFFIENQSPSASQFSIKLPSLFSRSWEKEEGINNIKDFFVKEKGSIVVTEAQCITHKVDISDTSKKSFTQPFIDTVKSMNEAIMNGTLAHQLQEFKRFVNEFGTHYASSTELGTKLSIERRYSSQERRGVKDRELKNCNTLAGNEFYPLISKFVCSLINLHH